MIKIGRQSILAIDNISLFIKKHKELFIILFLSFIMRYFLLDWNSYWLDEVISVYDRGIRFISSLDLLSYHSGRASYMPLYELVLYNWMMLFGHTEVATRLLSTIYVTLATLLLYLFTLRLFGKRLAIFSTLFFTLSYAGVYYSLESRYYGQVLFLSMLSSYLLFCYLDGLESVFSWKRLFKNNIFVLLNITNLALMLTHPFTYLFIFSQGVFVLFYFFYHNRKDHILQSSLKVFVLYLAQLMLIISLRMAFLLQFVNHIIRDFIGSAVAFAGSDTLIGENIVDFVEVHLRSPLNIFVQNILLQNLELPWPVPSIFREAVKNQYHSAIVFIIMFIIIAWFAVRYMKLFRKSDRSNIVSSRKSFIIYILITVFLPSIITFYLYSIFRFDRFFSRYLVYCIPPLMILAPFLIEQAISLIDGLLRRIMRISLIRNYLRYATIYAIIFSIIFVLPGGFRAATSRNSDWRGIANHIVQHIHQDPDHRYLVLETTHSNYKNTLLDYYFERFSNEVRVYDVLQRSVETSLIKDIDYTTFFLESEYRKEIEKHDYIIVTFHDLDVKSFPLTIEILSEAFTLSGSRLNNEGRGYMIFSVRNGN